MVFTRAQAPGEEGDPFSGRGSEAEERGARFGENSRDARSGLTLRGCCPRVWFASAEVTAGHRVGTG